MILLSCFKGQQDVTLNGKNAERTGQDGTSDDGQRCIVVINIYENVSRALVPPLTGQL